MGFFPSISYPRRTLKRKLFGYMLLLAALLLLTLMTGLFLFGRFHSTKDDAYETLDIQMDIFEKDILTYFDHMAAAGIQLSGSMGTIIDNHLQEAGLTMADLTDSEAGLIALQEAVLEPLKLKLLQEDCSGVFLILDATVNSRLPHGRQSRSGLYLQINGYDAYGQDILMFRGSAELAKQHDIMPHRKWRLEFGTERFPDYAQLLTLTEQPPERAYYLTRLAALPGTSEQVMLLVIPVWGADGSVYGFCGFEISESFFMTYHAQPTKIPHLTCLLTPGNGPTVQASAGLSCGIDGGYYRAPDGPLTTKPLSDGLLHFTGNALSCLGVMRPVSLTPNNTEFSLSVMILKEDYDQAVRKLVMQNLLLWLLILFFAVNCCLFFSRRFLSPILSGLEQLKTRERAQSNISEIDDLFAFLSEQDRLHEQALRTLTEEKRQMQSDFEKAQAKISRLSYQVKSDIDPDAYQYFLNGLQDLTVTERKVFDLYFAGKSAQEILEILQIKENTLKFHNKGIYNKLGVNSRKQLLQYAELLKQSQT